MGSFAFLKRTPSAPEKGRTSFWQGPRGAASYAFAESAASRSTRRQSFPLARIPLAPLTFHPFCVSICVRESAEHAQHAEVN